jgi:sigma-B regulation protein RsbU (phosphoserine phosphatase)
LLVTPDGWRFLETEKGMPLGLGFDGYSEVNVELPEGSRLLFYSDGITEAANADEEEYGTERLREHLQRPGPCTHSILEDVDRFVNGKGLHDDATVVLLEARRAQAD